MSDMHQDFSSGEPFEPEPQRQDSALVLPTEVHIVATALAVEKLRGLCDQMLLLLRHAPRDAATFDRVVWEASDEWVTAHRSYEAYRAVLECRGQA
ncbi:MAG TPA: hypothetical protein VGO06_28435 [Bosea sp. (in: a-proteobacteria)]|jgi:hypothetical protein|uniref:hypothetical protein n=1 Tax=Bosea sp. (in: a-proteobacteria) TaxID=1871050 RepID=UPI002E0FA9A1|nr:hypothetical protein [Bosea sp. (in: a-proteobacteria)]